MMGSLAITEKLRMLGLLVAIVVVISACGEDNGVPQKTYLHRSLETGDVGTNVYSAPPAGQSTILPREYPGSPALIPHSIVGFNIDKDGNSCLGCHATGISLGNGHVATKIPDSHYTDLVTEMQSDELQELRYNCTICHLQQSDAEALVLHPIP